MLRKFSLLLLFASSLVAGPNLLGTWQLNSKDSDGNPTRSEVTFREEQGALKASIRTSQTTSEARGIKQDGQRVSFEMLWEDDWIEVELEVKEEGQISGRWRAGEDTGEISGLRLAEASSWAGVWNLTATRPNGSTNRVDLHLRLEAGTWRAILRTTEGREVPTRDLNFSGDRIRFTIPNSQGDIGIELEREGMNLKGTWATPDRSKGPMEGTRARP